MQRQGVKPKLLIGLTSPSSLETMRGLREAGRGHDHPDQLRAGEPKAVAAAKPTAKFKGNADLHCMAAWENMFILKERHGGARTCWPSPTRSRPTAARSATGWPSSRTTDGLLGDDQAHDDREAVKPYVFVHAKSGQWAVLHNPL